MKVALVYTSTTPELIQMAEHEVKAILPPDTEILSYQDPSILADIRQAGYVTAAPAARLIGMYMKAVEDGADAILNLCSSVGEAADAAQEIGRYTGIPIVRVDEEMCRDAVRNGKKIAVMATLPTTLEPTKNTIKRAAREMNSHVELIDVLVEGAFGLDQNQFMELMLQSAGHIASEADVILFAQGSMAYCEELISQTYHKMVVSSPRYGAATLKEALTAKGLIERT